MEYPHWIFQITYQFLIIIETDVNTTTNNYTVRNIKKGCINNVAFYSYRLLSLWVHFVCHYCDSQSLLNSMCKFESSQKDKSRTKAHRSWTSQD